MHSLWHGLEQFLDLAVYLNRSVHKVGQEVSIQTSGRNQSTEDMAEDVYHLI